MRLHPINKIPVPFYTVHVDCVGPFPETPEGYKHLLLLVNAFTKFLFSNPLKTLSGLETCNALQIHLSLFGFTKVLITNRGTDFTDKAVKELLTKLEINHHLIAKSASRGNGKVESYVSTVLNLLRTEEKEGRMGKRYF